MTETEWLTCNDTDSLLLHIVNQPISRKLRLFGCACMRRLWDILPDDTHRRAVETCERFVDHRASEADLEKARQAVRDTYQGVGDIIADHAALIGMKLCSPAESFSIFGIEQAAAMAAEAQDDSDFTWDEVFEREQAIQCELLRDVIGNPFRPLSIDPAWLQWNAGAVKKIAAAIYEESAFDRMPILADALEEAGCTNADILDHCRSGGEHVRGCWVVDLLLGKQ
jgi:hypothetical protein